MKQAITKKPILIIKFWKNIGGYTGLYQISDTGDVYSSRRNKYLKPQMLKITKEKGGGYLKVNLIKNGKVKGFLISRLVAKAFISNHKKLTQVNHIDGDKTNNYVENLEWISGKENNRHAYRIGLNSGCKGEKNGRAKLNKKDIRRIREMYKLEVENMTSLAKMYDVTITTISNIINRKK